MSSRVKKIAYDMVDKRIVLGTADVLNGKFVDMPNKRKDVTVDCLIAMRDFLLDGEKVGLIKDNGDKETHYIFKMEIVEKEMPNDK